MRKKKKIFTLTFIMFIAIFVRYLAAPSEGFVSDMNLNQGWAKGAVELGIGKFYKEHSTDYLPVPIYLWKTAGHVYQELVDPEYHMIQPQHRILNKTPAILSDIVTIVLIFYLVSSWYSPKKGLIAAAIYAIHPAVIFDSAFWGQTDSVYTLFVFAALLALITHRSLLTGVLTSIAFFSKPQAMVFIPLILFSIPLSLLFIATFITGLFIPTILLLAPIYQAGTLDKVLYVFTGAVDRYTNVSLNAFNLWWGITDGWQPDTNLLYNTVSYKTVGLVLFSIVFALTFTLLGSRLRGKLSNKKNGQAIFAAASVIAMAFFILNTQMHERYLFPFLALYLPIAMTDKKRFLLYIGISVCFYINLTKVLHTEHMHQILYHQFPRIDASVAVIQTILLIVLIRIELFYKGWFKDLQKGLQQLIPILTRTKK